MLSNCESFELFCPENLKQTNLYLSLKHKVGALFLLKSLTILSHCCAYFKRHVGAQHYQRKQALRQHFSSQLSQ